ncbi:NnrS family protein, partial [Mesorhizobium sp. M7A.F.Ca.CA.001.06.1.1]
VSASILLPAIVPVAAGLHAFGVGAVGSMTVAVMARATLGHTGRQLRAGLQTIVVFAAILIAALSRILAVFLPKDAIVNVAGVAWVLAFAGFLLAYGVALTTPKAK